MKYELINFCEIDKYAEKSYCAIHNISNDKNLGDITSVDINKLPKNIDLITHGSPCTSFSRGGYQEGGDKGSNTPSALMWYSIEIIRYCLPKFIIWENVSNVLNKKHRHNFDAYIEELNQIGYFSYYKVLNGKNFGIPQNRDRIFVISINKEIDKGFIFPKEKELTYFLSDCLEPVIDIPENFYLTEKQINHIRTCPYDIYRRRIQEKLWCDTLCARDYKGPKCIEDSKGIRKLTPKEYWRIMGFKDKDFEKIKSIGLSNSSLYKQAGNSIILDIVKEIFINLRNQYSDIFKDNLKYLSLFSGIGAFEMALRDI